MAPHQEKASPNDYIIWSNEHMAWWGPGRRGYSKGLKGVGTYSRDQALEICRESLPTAAHIGMISEIPVRVADVREFLQGAIIPQGVI